MTRLAYLLGGMISLLLATVGAVLPLLPTVPFLILAAFCFARGSPRLEALLVQHPRFGPHIQAWRSRGAISRKGKRAAFIAFALSAVLGFVLLTWPWSVLPLVVGIIGAAWIATRPSS
ncbi:YbaN family protein [Allosphingosinicella humi]